MVRTDVWRTVVLALVIGWSITGCQGDAVLIPQTEEPFLYIVLNERTLQVGPDMEHGQHALLLDASSPLEEARFREAERFEMTAASDNALLGWREDRPHNFTGPGSYPAPNMRTWNYHLPDEREAGLGGTGDLLPGAAYRLEIETGDHLITGEVVIPGQIEPRRVTVEGVDMLTWPSVPRAAGYRIFFGLKPRLTPDTIFPVPAGQRSARIEAVDANLWAYLTDQDLSRSGIEGARGVLGAVTTATLEF